MSLRRPYPSLTPGALKTSGLFGWLNADRVVPIPEGSRNVAQGLYSEHLPLEERVALVQEGRRRLSDEDQGEAIRREALEAFRAGTFAGGAGAVVLPLLTKTLETSIEAADKRRIDLIANEVFGATNAPGSFYEAIDPAWVEEGVMPKGKALLIGHNVRARTGANYTPRSDGQHAQLKSLLRQELKHNDFDIPMTLAARGAAANSNDGLLSAYDAVKDAIPENTPKKALLASYPAAHRPGTLDAQDFRNIGRIYLDAAGGDADLAGANLSALGSFVDAPGQRFYPRGEALDHAFRADKLARRGALAQAEDALLGNARKATHWLQTPIHPTVERGVTSLMERGMAAGPVGSAASLVLTPTARMLTSRGAAVAGGVGVLAAAAAAVKERMQQGKMRAMAEQGYDATAAEILAADRSTADALAQSLRPENPLTGLGASARSMRLDPGFLVDSLVASTMVEAGMV